MHQSLKRGILIIFTLAVILGFYFQKQSSAQTSDFSGIVPFSTPGGLMGFFSQKEGIVYFYDTSLTECLQVHKVDSLGQPMRKIR